MKPNCAALNARLLHMLPYAAVKDRLGSTAMRPSGLRCAAISTVLADVKQWWDVVYGDITPVIAAGRSRLHREPRRLLPPEPWDGSDLEGLDRCAQGARPAARARRCSCRCGWRSPASIMGRSLPLLLPLIGRERALKRLHSDRALIAAAQKP